MRVTHTCRASKRRARNAKLIMSRPGGSRNDCSRYDAPEAPEILPLRFAIEHGGHRTDPQEGREDHGEWSPDPARRYLRTNADSTALATKSASRRLPVTV